MLRLARLIAILILATAAPLLAAASADVDLELGLDVDASRIVSAPDSIEIPDYVRHDWRELLRQGRLEVNDTSIRYPAFIDFCLRVYRWAEKTFNTYDPRYVSGTGKHGKVRLVSDNWTDMYYFQFSDGKPLFMASNLYCNMGFQANYSILSLSYSFDMSSFLSDKTSKHKKLGFSFSCARIYGEAYYWENDGSTVIREIELPSMKDAEYSHVPFDGLSFKAYGAMAFYIFNYSRFSFAAAYNLSNYQLKSAGSWMLGASGTRYDCKFDFTKLPDYIVDNSKIPHDSYRLNYNSINVTGGYSFNWAINRHLLFNTTTLPGLGISFSFTDSTPGRKDLFSMTVRQMLSLTYTNRQFFATLNGSFHGNLLPTTGVRFNSGIGNFQVSTGVRF